MWDRQRRDPQADRPGHVQIDNLNRGYVGILMAEADPKDKDGKDLGAKIIRP